MILTGWALAWHLVGRPGFRWRHLGIQANRSWVQRGPLGLVYFGALLGAGVITEMSTPLAYAWIAAAGANGVSWGVIAGLGAGLGRATPAFAGAARLAGAMSPGSIGRYVYADWMRRARWPGALASLATLATLIL
jgi:hypothetical protein